MLTTLAAFQLVLLAQVPNPPRLVPAEDERAIQAAQAAQTQPTPTAATPPAPAPAAAAPAAGAAPAKGPNPPRLVPAEDERAIAAAQAAAQQEPQAASTAAPAATRPAPERAPIPSLQSAEPLRGASAVFAWGGWPRLGGAWLMGVTAEDDLGVVADLDWARTELRLGGLYRRPFGTAGGWDVAGRLGLSWYAGFGSSWIYADNHSDRGIELAPALVLSRRTGGGVFSLSGEAPMTFTVRYDSGFLFVPKLAGAYEMPLVQGLTVGARIAIGYRAGAGDAPLKEGRGELEFLVLAGWQLL